MSGLAYQAMKKAGEECDELAQRVRFFNYRCREEFYDFSRDPDALHNLIDVPEYQNTIAVFRGRLGEYLRETSDPVWPAFRKETAQKESK